MQPTALLRFRSRAAISAGVAVLTALFAVTIATPARATLVSGGHTCKAVGASYSGYTGGVCVDADVWTNSAGQKAIRTLGQAFCQRTSDSSITRCAGVQQNPTIVDTTDGDRTLDRFTGCGRYPDYAQCPSGRYQSYSEGVLCVSGHRYQVTSGASLVLPESAKEVYQYAQVYLTVTC